MYFVEKVKTILKNLVNHKILLKDPLGSINGPRLVIGHGPYEGLLLCLRVP